MAVPDWLLTAEVGMCPCGCIGRRRRTGFVDKTIAGAASLLGLAMFNEDVAEQPGLLQRLDARVKLITLLALLTATALLHHVPLLLGMYAITLGLAAASGIDLRFFVKRVWLFIPVFTGIVVLPAIFSFVTPGHVVLGVGTVLGLDLDVTAQGLRGAGLIVTRVATSISLVVLLTLTTPWTDLLAALRALRIPKTFVLIIGMAHRYLFVLVETVSDMFVARKARTLGAQDHGASGRAFVSASAGVLLGKTHALSEEIHMAMLARGYHGDARALTRGAIGLPDIAWSITCLLVIAAVLGGDHALGT